MRIRDQSGMTLVEVLVSVALIAIVAVPMLQLFSASALSSTSGRYTSIAASVAQATVEEVRAGLYDLNGRLADRESDLIALNAHPDFKRHLSVSDDTVSQCKRVTVTVSWTKGSDNRSIQVTTLIR